MTDNLLTVAGVILGSGAAGGFVFGLATPSRYTLTMPLSGKQHPMGFLGDLIVGATTGVAVFFLGSALLNVELSDLTVDGYLRTAALGVIAGFSGIGLLKRLSATILSKVEDLEVRIKGVQEGSRPDLLVGYLHLKDGEAEKALDSFNSVLGESPRNVRALIGRGGALKQLHRFDEAIDVASRALAAASTTEMQRRALYNRACYKALSDSHVTKDVLKDLKSALQKDEMGVVRGMALADPDFESVREDNGFRKLIST